MEKSKKIILILIGILLVSVLNCSYVFADNMPTYYISEEINADKILTATVSFTENTAAAGTIKLSYNTDILTLLSAEKGTSKAQMITLNEKELGTVSINFLNAEDVIKGDTNIAILKFSISSCKISEHDIKVDSFKLYNLESKLLSDNNTTKPVYKLDKENAPSDISVTSKNEEISNEPSEVGVSVENSNIEPFPVESQTTDDETTVDSSLINDRSDVAALSGDASSVWQDASEKKSDNTVLFVVIMVIIIFVTVYAAIIIIRKQNSKNGSGGQQNEK